MASASRPSALSRMKSASWVCTRYTFCMKQVVWFVLLAVAGGFGYWLWRLRQRWQERSRAAEERFATLMAQARPSAPAAMPAAIPAAIPAVPPAHLSQQKLPLHAAAKAGEAREAASPLPLHPRPP